MPGTTDDALVALKPFFAAAAKARQIAAVKIGNVTRHDQSPVPEKIPEQMTASQKAVIVAEMYPLKSRSEKESRNQAGAWWRID